MTKAEWILKSVGLTAEQVKRMDKGYIAKMNEERYHDMRSIRGGGVSVCAGGVAAEAAYNGGGSEEDISFGQAVANYERGE